MAITGKSSQFLAHFALLLSVCFFPLAINAASVENSTLTLPPGASNHGNPNLICVPTKWTDVAVFFLGNYVAHAATITAIPGASFLDTILDGIKALLVPVSGVNRGLNALFSLAKLARTDLQTAARAGALCEVIVVGEGKNEGVEPQRPKIFQTQPWVSASIYGRVKLPSGYGLAVLPANSKFEEDDYAEDNPPITLSTGYSAIKILVSVSQLIFASSTLYRTRGDQIARYGYAAFGLTVTQYALMSLLNLLGSLMCPQYPSYYLVESRTMDEARKIAGTVIEGAVGRLVENHEQRRQRPHRFSETSTQWWKSKKKLARLPFALAPTAVSVLIIWLLSGFRKGSSTVGQRIWIATWLALGSIIGIAGAEVRDGHNMMEPHPPAAVLHQLGKLILGGAPAIGGFVVVGQMLHDYGVCTDVS